MELCCNLYYILYSGSCTVFMMLYNCRNLPTSSIIAFCAAIIFSFSSCPDPESNVYPIEYNSSKTPLEPSGITRHKGRLLFVSDNEEDKFIYELIPSGTKYIAKIFAGLNKKSLPLFKKQRLDLEGIAAVKDEFYCVDERNRFIYRVKKDGDARKIDHDITQYNKKHGLSFSRDSNNGFEGIAYDRDRDLLFIANEKDDAVIYTLRFKGDALTTIGHISMQRFRGMKEIDIGDINYVDNYLYILYRRKNKIIKAAHREKIIAGTYDFSGHADGLYRAGRKGGFAEGLLITDDKIFILFDSDGQRMTGKKFGENGALIILERPREF